MDNSAERIRILEMIDSGQINAEEGLRLLAALQDQADLEEDAGADLEEPISAAVLPPPLDASPAPGFVEAPETAPVHRLWPRLGRRRRCKPACRRSARPTRDRGRRPPR